MAMTDSTGILEGDGKFFSSPYLVMSFCHLPQQSFQTEDAQHPLHLVENQTGRVLTGVTRMRVLEKAKESVLLISGAHPVGGSSRP